MKLRIVRARFLRLVLHDYAGSWQHRRCVPASRKIDLRKGERKRKKEEKICGHFDRAAAQVVRLNSGDAPPTHSRPCLFHMHPQHFRRHSAHRTGQYAGRILPGLGDLALLVGECHWGAGESRGVFRCDFQGPQAEYCPLQHRRRGESQHLNLPSDPRARDAGLRAGARSSGILMRTRTSGRFFAMRLRAASRMWMRFRIPRRGS